MKKKFKLHTHHFTSITLENPRKRQGKSRIFLFFYHVGNAVLRVGGVLVAAAWFAVSRSGTGAYAGVKKIITAVKTDTARTRQSLPRRAKIFHSREFRQSLALFIFLCLCGAGVFKTAAFMANAIELKNSIFRGTQSGVDSLTRAEQDLAEQNSGAADAEFASALQDFSTGKQQLVEGNTMMLDVLSVIPQTRTAKNILDAATNISEAGRQVVVFYNSASTFSFSEQGLNSAGGVPGTLKTMDAALSAATGDIGSANTELRGVDPGLLPASKRQEFVQLSQKLQAAQVALVNLQQIFSFTRRILSSETTLLLLFENNNELRPGGGFIGTYGKATLDRGKIQNLTISSIYDLDGQLTENISPPEPVLNVNNRWYLRDSNWFADFSASAKSASNFYEMEGGETPGMVVAITPTVISSLLAVTGPVPVPAFNVILNADNFIEQTQAISTISDTMPLNQPKQILADFYPLFIQKLKTLNGNQYKQLLSVLLGQLGQKQIVFAAQDKGLEDEIQSFNWGGNVFSSDRDYLQMVSANLGGTKTDLSLQKKLDLQTTVSPSGITDDLTVTITNQLPKMNDTQNTSFIRFLVPQGSKLLSVTGFDEKNLDSSGNSSYKQDPAVAEWQNGMVKEEASGTLIGSESGKTFFGNWLTVQGGETRTIHLQYELPFTLQSPDRYSLTLQKQTGSQNDQFDYTVNFGGKALKWENFVPDSVTANQLTASAQIDKDYFFGMVLEKR